MKSKTPHFDWKIILAPLHWITVLSVFVVDQLTKLAVVTWVQLGDRHEIIPGFLNLVHTKNKGAAFGIFHDSSPMFRLFFFGAVTLICVFLLLSWLGTTPKSEVVQRFALSLILGGALGNLIDRALFGEVTDFVDAYYNFDHFPAFNVADSGITIGVILIFWKLIPFEKVKAKRRRRQS